MNKITKVLLQAGNDDAHLDIDDDVIYIRADVRIEIRADGLYLRGDWKPRAKAHELIKIGELSELRGRMLGKLKWFADAWDITLPDELKEGPHEEEA